MPIELNNAYLIVGSVILLIIIIGLVYFILHLKEVINTKEKINEEYKKEIVKLQEKNDRLTRKLSRIVYDEYIQSQTKIRQKYKSSKKLKVVIGDYMLESSIITNTVLKNLGIETIVVSSPEDIIDIVDSGMDIDFIITNNIYKSSNLDGPKMLYKLREEHNCKIPIVILTVSGGREHYFINDCGFNGYLTKPLKIDNAIECIEKIKPKIKFNKLP